MVFVVYGAAAVLALALLYFIHANWYWHVLSLVAALAVGFMPADMIPVPAAWGTTRDILVGGVFIFLAVWGIAAPLFRRHHHTEAPHQV
jgi:hypothetical protein